MIAIKTASIRYVVVLCALTVIAAAAGADEQTVSPAPVNPQSHFDRMARFLSSAQQLQTSARMGYDVVQSSGQKIEFSERREITIARPDRLRVEMLKSNGEEGVVLFDGQRITVYSAAHEVYAQAEIPGNLDEVLVHFLRDLKMRMSSSVRGETKSPSRITAQS